MLQEGEKEIEKNLIFFFQVSNKENKSFLKNQSGIKRQSAFGEGDLLHW